MKGFRRWLNSTTDIDSGYAECFKKFAYPTEEIALEALTKSQKRSEYALRYYKCTICKGFHLTKKTLEPAVEPELPSEKVNVDELRQKYFDTIFNIRRATQNFEFEKAKELKLEKKLLVKELKSKGCRVG